MTAAAKNKALDPGFHPRIPMEAYLRLPGASSSRLRMMRVAPAKVYEDIIHPPEPTDAFRIGDALHAAILEPHRFEKEYVVATQCTGTTKTGANAGKRCINDGKVLHRKEGWLCGVHAKPFAEDEFVPFSHVLTNDQHAMCLKARDNALVHSKAARAFLSKWDGEVELTGWWNDASLGVGCRLRGDRVVDHTATCVDLKSTDDASPAAFAKSIFNFGYYDQQGFYHEGFEQLSRPMENHVIVAVEKKPPYLVAVYRLTDEVITAGRNEMREHLAAFAACEASGVWPGYPDEVQDISVPGWAWDRLHPYLPTTPAAAQGGMEMIR